MVIVVDHPAPTANSGKYCAELPNWAGRALTVNAAVETNSRPATSLRASPTTVENGDRALDFLEMHLSPRRTNRPILSFKCTAPSNRRTTTMGVGHVPINLRPTRGFPEAAG